MIKLTKYQNQISSDIYNVCELINDMLTFIVVSYGQLNDCVEFELKVILNELIINAIKHGNNSDVSKKVKTSITISKSGFVFIIIEDEGEGYDYKCRVRNKDIAVNEDFCDLKETGRGIVIVSNLCDKIKFNKKGNKVIVMKRL